MGRYTDFYYCKKCGYKGIITIWTEECPGCGKRVVEEVSVKSKVKNIRSAVENER